MQLSDATHPLGLTAQDPHPVGAVGRPEMLNQGLPGLVLQLLQGGSGDLQGWDIGPGFQVAEAFNHKAEHDLSHGGTSPSRTPSLGRRSHRWRAAEYGVPSPGTPRRLGGSQTATCNNQKIEGLKKRMNAQTDPDANARRLIPVSRSIRDFRLGAPAVLPALQQSCQLCFHGNELLDALIDGGHFSGDAVF